jgi:signal transduction histidine kinase
VELHPVDLAETIRKVVEEEKPSIDEVGGRVTLRFGPMHVRADAALISQVFTNLITNCVKYRSPDRPLDISIESETMQQYWVIRVRDNGSGIEDADAGHIFNIFARAKPHAGVEGAGIGLALCRRITDLHGGTIEHIPTEEDGSVFEVKLFKARRPEHG